MSSDTPLQAMLRANGIVNPQWTDQCSAKVGLSLAACCAVLDMESSGGLNEFGHDPGNPIVGGTVTHARYQLMRHYVSEGYPSQGVGPCQLTSVSLLDRADQLGGSWDPIPNLIVGFTFLKQLRYEFGPQGGFQHYNGSGLGAVEYGERAIALEQVWQERINKVL